MRYILFFLLTASITSCSIPNQPGNAITVDSSDLNDSSGTGWLAYGLSLAAWDANCEDNSNLYEREVYARESTAKVWEELRANGDTVVDKELDELVLVEKSGYIREYVWNFLRKSDWKKPANLRINDFVVWKNKNIPNHSPTINPPVLY